MSARRARPYRLHDAEFLVFAKEKSWASETPRMLRDMFFPYLMGKKIPAEVEKRMRELIREDAENQRFWGRGQPASWRRWARRVVDYAVGKITREDLLSALSPEEVISLAAHECNEEIGIRSRETRFEGVPFLNNFGPQGFTWTRKETAVEVTRLFGLWLCDDLDRHGYLESDCPAMVFSYRTTEKCETSIDMNEPSRFMAAAANTFLHPSIAFSWRTIFDMVNAYWFVHKDKNRLGELLPVIAGICDQMGLPV